MAPSDSRRRRVHRLCQLRRPNLDATRRRQHLHDGPRLRWPGANENDTNNSTTADFLNLENTPTNSIVGPNTNPNEGIGPCSRKTGIVISEIIYKPAPRNDTNNCEYLEIHNTQPYFHDISGYQITCADMSYTFPLNTTIPAGGYIVVAASPDSIQNVYGMTNVMGPYTGSLKKSETLQLLDEHRRQMLTTHWHVRRFSAQARWPRRRSLRLLPSG